MSADYESMTDEELELENQALQAKRFEIGREQDKLCAVLHSRQAEAHAAQLLDGLAPGTLDVLVKAAAAKLSGDAPAPGEEA